MTGNSMLQRGWLDRSRKAKASMGGGDSDKARVNAERQAYYAEQRRIADAEAETRRAQTAQLKVSCPVCDHGSVTIEAAELVIRALERLPAGSLPDEYRLQILHAVASGDTYHGPHALRPANGAHYPRKVNAATFAAVPASTMDAPEEADALAAVQAETTKPAKAARRHVAPPLLEGDE